MNRKLLLPALLFTAIAACKPQAPVEPAVTADTASAEATAAPAPVAAESAPSASAADVPFDVKGFAGTFSGTLSCADCPGIDSRITLAADGTYRLQEARQGQPDTGIDSDGTWTAEENGSRIRLDPNSKSEMDRLYAVTSKDQLDPLDADGKPAAGAPLKRESVEQ